MFIRFLTLIVIFLCGINSYAQNIEGIELGEEKQKDSYIELDGISYQVMPVEDEASELVCGVMYIPVNKDSKIPTTLDRNHIQEFEAMMERQYAIQFDSVMNYNDEATLKFVINDSEGIEYEFNQEKVGDEYDSFFVIWYENMAKNSIHRNGK